MEFKITKKQNEFLTALKSRLFQFLIFGGGVGAGKSVVLAVTILGCANQYPKSRWGVFRKNLTVLKRTTLQTFIRVADELNITYNLNRADLVMTLSNGSEILFIELDHTKDPDFNKIKGLELTGAGIDEINEIIEKAFSTLITRIGRWNYHKEPSFIIGTCNPDGGWVKQKFYTPWSNNTLQPPYFFLQALPKDNPFLSKEYMKQLEYLPASEYQRYVLGNWDYADDPNQLITFEMLRSNLLEKLPTEIVGDVRMGVDVARSGADKTVFHLIDDEKLFKSYRYRGNDTKTTALNVRNIIDEQKILHENVNIDIIGIGAGVFDNLVSWSYNVSGFNSASSPTKARDDSFDFFNKRAEAYWNLRDACIGNTMGILNTESNLIEELLAVRYEIRGKKIIIEEKSKIKSRLNRSPDDSDALAMAKFTPQETNFYFVTA